MKGKKDGKQTKNAFMSKHGAWWQHRNHTSRLSLPYRPSGYSLQKLMHL